MLPEIGGAELIVIAAVALIVVGPKDLPVLLRRVGQAVGKMRALAADFRASFDEMARQTELDELRKEVEALRQGKITDNLGADPTFDEINHALQPASVSYSPYDSPADPELEADRTYNAALPDHFTDPTREAEVEPPTSESEPSGVRPLGEPLPDQPPPGFDPPAEKRA